MLPHELANLNIRLGFSRLVDKKRAELRAIKSPTAIAPVLTVNSDDAAAVVALAREVGLAGFGKPEPSHSAANENFVASTPADTSNPDDGADVLALAASVGLRGFVK